MAIVSEFKVNVLPDAHAWDAVSEAEALNVPAAAAVHSPIWERVSETPPFVQVEAIEDIAFEPAAAAAIVACTRVVDPVAGVFAPVAPGSPM
jgi:hypothetical protein